MKKLFVLCSALVAMAGCGKHYDSDCGYVYFFEVVNESDSEVIAVTEKSGALILTGKSQIITDDSFEMNCGLMVLPDVYQQYDLILRYQKRYLIVDQVFMPETIWTREYWTFDNSRGTYTLVVTNKLIETILAGQQE